MVLLIHNIALKPIKFAGVFYHKQDGGAPILAAEQSTDWTRMKRLNPIYYGRVTGSRSYPGVLCTYRYPTVSFSLAGTMTPGATPLVFPNSRV
jgi:hypothetical protein